MQLSHAPQGNLSLENSAETAWTIKWVCFMVKETIKTKTSAFLGL